MSIIKTVFTGSTLAAQQSELLNYLETNATDYFDEISADSSGNISCYVGETVALLIGMDGTTARRVTLTNGTYVELTSVTTASNPRSALFKCGKKTANGILLVAASSMIGSYNAGSTTIFITRNENNETCILGYFQETNNQSSTATYFFADIKNDNSIFKPLTNTTYSNLSQLSRSAPMTALTPVIFNGGHYAPKAFVTTFNQFALTEADLSINGKSYTTDGVIALED